MLKIVLHPVLFLFHNQLTVNEIEIKTKQHTKNEAKKSQSEHKEWMQWQSKPSRQALRSDGAYMQWK